MKKKRKKPALNHHIYKLQIESLALQTLVLFKEIKT